MTTIELLELKTAALAALMPLAAGAAEIDARPRLRTGEILEVVPGLIVTQHSGTGKSNQMFLRRLPRVRTPFRGSS